MKHVNKGITIKHFDNTETTIKAETKRKAIEEAINRFGTNIKIWGVGGWVSPEYMLSYTSPFNDLDGK